MPEDTKTPPPAQAAGTTEQPSTTAAAAAAAKADEPKPATTTKDSKVEPKAASGHVDQTIAVLRTAVPAPATKAYRFRENAGKHTHAGEDLKPGDVVQLTEKAAKAFRDKFDAVDQ